MYLLIKPASGACDFGCRCCFYSDEMSCRHRAVRGIMSRETAVPATHAQTLYGL